MAVARLCTPSIGGPHLLQQSYTLQLHHCTSARLYLGALGQQTNRLRPLPALLSIYCLLFVCFLCLGVSVLEPPNFSPAPQYTTTRYTPARASPRASQPAPAAPYAYTGWKRAAARAESGQTYVVIDGTPVFVIIMKIEPVPWLCKLMCAGCMHALYLKSKYIIL